MSRSLLFARFGKATISFANIVAVVLDEDNGIERAVVYLTSGVALGFYANKDPEVYAALKRFRDEAPDVAALIEDQVQDRAARREAAEEEDDTVTNEDGSVTMRVAATDAEGFLNFLGDLGIFGEKRK